MQKDWETVVLLALENGSAEYSAFLSQYQANEQPEIVAALKNLRRCGFIRVYFEPDTLISLTSAGSEELLRLKRYLEEKRNAKKRDRAGWVQWIGSNAIALIALIISAIALAAQLGILPLPSLR